VIATNILLFVLILEVRKVATPPKSRPLGRIFVAFVVLYLGAHLGHALLWGALS
jgi:hypothetical protein